MLIRTTIALLFALPTTAFCATHSAWSVPIAWDAVTAVHQTVKPQLRINADLHAWPNPVPASGILHVPMAQTIGGHASPVSLSLIDMNGRTVRHVRITPNATAAPFSWSLNTGKAPPLAPGIFTIRLIAGDITQNRRIAVSRQGGAR